MNPARAPVANSKPTVALTASLCAVVAEIEQIASGTEALQTTLSPLLRQGVEGAEAAQALDEITQQLFGLAEYLTCLSLDCPADWGVNAHAAASRLNLHAQKLRLSLAEAPPPPPSGELDLW